MFVGLLSWYVHVVDTHSVLKDIFKIVPDTKGLLRGYFTKEILVRGYCT